MEADIGPQQREKSSPSNLWMVIVLIAIAILFGRRMLTSQDSTAAPANLPPLKVSGWLNTDQPITDASLVGKVVLVDCWASWCGPCRINMPELVDFKDRFAEEDVEVLGLTSEDGNELANVASFVRSVDGMDWPIGYGAGPTMKELGVTSLPTLLVFDRQGQTVWSGHFMQQAEDAVVKALAR